MSRRVFAVRPVVEADWRKLKAQRLEMLADTPIAYLDTLRSALAQPDSYWRRRARGSADAIRIVAETPEGDWLGQMGGVVQDGAATLVGVYVTPAARGRRAGVLDELLGHIEAWASELGDQLRLEVNEFNPRAIAAYESRGFVRTGRTFPYPLEPPSLELEMVKPLRLR